MGCPKSEYKDERHSMYIVGDAIWGLSDDGIKRCAKCDRVEITIGGRKFVVTIKQLEDLQL